jgi:hypothetical protein
VPARCRHVRRVAQHVAEPEVGQRRQKRLAQPIVVVDLQHLAAGRPRDRPERIHDGSVRFRAAAAHDHERQLTGRKPGRFEHRLLVEDGGRVVAVGHEDGELAPIRRPSLTATSMTTTSERAWKTGRCAAAATIAAERAGREDGRSLRVIACA